MNNSFSVVTLYCNIHFSLIFVFNFLQYLLNIFYEIIYKLIVCFDLSNSSFFKITFLWFYQIIPSFCETIFRKIRFMRNIFKRQKSFGNPRQLKCLEKDVRHDIREKTNCKGDTTLHVYHCPPMYFSGHVSI